MLTMPFPFSRCTPWRCVAALALAGLVAMLPAAGSAAGCAHEITIEKLRQAMAEHPPTAAQADGRARRLVAIQQIHDLDINSRFTLTTNQDYEATLKFDTPEEQLRDSIVRLIDWVSWLESGGMGEAAYGGRTLARIKQTRENLGNLKSAIEKYGKFTAGRQQQKGKFEELLKIYLAQAKIRGDALAGLTHLADVTACRSMTPAELALVGLYHDRILNSRSCSTYEKKALADRVKRASSGPAFGSLLDSDVYAAISKTCHLPTPESVLNDSTPDNGATDEVYSNGGGYACFGGAAYPDRWQDDARCNDYGCYFGRKRSPEECLALGKSKNAAEVVYGTSGSRAKECWLQNGCADKRPHGNFTYFVDQGAGSSGARGTAPPPKPRPCDGKTYNPYGCN